MEKRLKMSEFDRLNYKWRIDLKSIQDNCSHEEICKFHEWETCPNCFKAIKLGQPLTMAESNKLWTYKKDSDYDKLVTSYQKSIKELEQRCNHVEISDWMEGDEDEFRTCNNCGKIMEQR